ncbi:MAG: hypothetical protein ACSLEW_14610 [Nocardioides sp.]
MNLRHLAVGLSTSLVVSTLVGAPAHAESDTDTAPRDAAVGWLINQLDGGLLPSSYGGAAYGPSADAVISLAEIGNSTDAAAIAGALATDIDDYVTGEAYGDTGSLYSGSAAKATVALVAAGLDPGQVGDDARDLLGDVRASIQQSGRIQDTSLYGDYANTFGQAFAVQALTTAGSPEAPAATDFLVSQQCDPGWLRLYFTATAVYPDPQAQDDTSCDADPSSGPSVDSTALAVMALAPSVKAGTATPATARALGRAESWLLSVQQADGGWADGTTDATANTNSTGLAGRAMIATDHLGAARRAAVWVRSQQIHNVGECTPFDAADIGALGYDRTAWRNARSTPVGDSNDQFIQAAVQALPVLEVLEAADSAPTISGPAHYVKDGAKVTYNVSGLAPGRPVCVSVPGSAALRVADADGAASVRVRMPAATGTVVATVEDESANTATAATEVLGGVELALKAPAEARIGSNVTVKVTGLAAGEEISLQYRAKRVSSGTATTKGVFTAKVAVKGPQGKAAITATGQFADRSGSRTLRVLPK